MDHSIVVETFPARGAAPPESRRHHICETWPGQDGLGWSRNGLAIRDVRMSGPSTPPCCSS